LTQPAQRELPTNYKERPLLRDRIREKIPECPELEFKFILGKHADEADAEFSAENFADSDIVLIELPGHDSANFNSLMREQEEGERDFLGILEELSSEEFIIAFPEHLISLLKLAHKQGKIIRCADISYSECADIDYMFSELDKFADRIKQSRLSFDEVIIEMKNTLRSVF